MGDIDLPAFSDFVGYSDTIPDSHRYAIFHVRFLTSDADTYQRGVDIAIVVGMRGSDSDNDAGSFLCFGIIQVTVGPMCGIRKKENSERYEWYKPG